MNALRPVSDTQTNRHPEWSTLYRVDNFKELPWYVETLDSNIHDFFASVPVNQETTILDVGTGDGTQAYLLAKRGFAVTGIDISPSAIELCSRFATNGLSFQQADVLTFQSEMSFQYVIDRGCMHVLTFPQLPEYRDQIHRLLKPGGQLLLLCFTGRPDAVIGPHSYTESDIERIFFGKFQIRDMRLSTFSGPRQGQPNTIFTVLERL